MGAGGWLLDGTYDGGPWFLAHLRGHGWFLGRVSRWREEAALGLDALARKYNLEVDPRWLIAPDPVIKGWFWPATYKRYMQGHIHGVAVVAFDYEIGLPMNRGNRRGSCAGVQRNILDVNAISRSLVPVRVDGWTFFYSYALFNNTHGFNADDIERLWDQMLLAPAGGMEPALFGVDVPGGIVIRPVKVR